jgi:hypothetical protein
VSRQAVTDAETWLPIEDFEGIYEISSDLRVKSLERTVTVRGIRKVLRERILRPSIDAHSGLTRVTLYRNGYRLGRYCHALWREAQGW